MPIKNHQNPPYMSLPRYLDKSGLSVIELGLLNKLCFKAIYYWNNPDFGIVKFDFKKLYTDFKISKPTFNKYIKLLEQKKYIEIMDFNGKKRLKICNFKDFQHDNRRSLTPQARKKFERFFDDIE